MKLVPSAKAESVSPTSDYPALGGGLSYTASPRLNPD